MPGLPAHELTQWMVTAFAVRLILMLVIHFTGAERALKLTGDAFFYDEIGQQVARSWQLNNPAIWPERVKSVIDFGWEYTLGVVYYMFGHVPLLAKMICVTAGTVTPYLYYRTSLMVTDNVRVSRIVLILGVFFPTQVYYSTMLVRDSISTMAVALVFLGIATYVSRPREGWLLPLAAGLVLLAGLRSYVLAALLFAVPIGFVITAMVSSSRATSSRYRNSVAGLLIAVLLVGAVFWAPGMLDDLDMKFMDLDFMNKVRVKMNKGSGALFGSPNQVTTIGDNVTETIISIIVGLYFFFFSVNPLQIVSVRQLMAIPEAAMVVFGAIYTIRGARILWRERRDQLLPVLIPTFALTFGYSAVTTNGGPLMRWRTQLVGAYLILAATGWAFRHVAHQVRKRPVARRRMAARPPSELPTMPTGPSPTAVR